MIMSLKGARIREAASIAFNKRCFPSILSGKKPAVAIYDTDGKWGKYEHRIWVVAKELGVRYIWFSNNEIIER